MKNRIQEIVDETLARMRAVAINMMVPGEIPEEMLDTSILGSEDWRAWKAIPSIVTDVDLDRLEGKIGRKLPPSYRELLQYKHFGCLDIPNRAVRLFSHWPDHHFRHLVNHIHNYDSEGLIDQGYIYFADFEDYGYLCFDTNVPRENNEWKVVYIDHEELDVVHDYAENFLALLEGDD
jgi:hypothetical protein